MISRRTGYFTTALDARDPEGSPTSPWSARFRAIGLGCYFTVGIGILAFLIAR
jgi:hypothetical protein